MGGQGDRMGHRGGYAAAVRGGGPSDGENVVETKILSFFHTIFFLFQEGDKRPVTKALGFELI